MLLNIPFVIIAPVKFVRMGKGDKKTKKGKIAIGSYGNTRKRHANKPKKAVAAKKVAEPAAETAAKVRKTARKKSEA